MDRFLVTIQTDSQDCDGPMSWQGKQQEMSDVEVMETLGSHCLRFESIGVREESDCGTIRVYEFYRTTDEGYRRVEIEVRMVEESETETGGVA